MSAARHNHASSADARPSRPHILASELGATVIEYALVAGFIASVIFLSLVGLGGSIRDLPFELLVDATSGNPSP